MKLALFTLAIFGSICFVSCQKETIIPGTDSSSITTTTGTTTTTTTAPLTQAVTAPEVDTVKGYLRVQLAANATSTDNILINFNPKASAAYVINEDAPYFKGFGAVNLSSLTSDGKACAINAMPLTTQGTSVALKVNAKTDGTYQLNMMTIQAIPSNFNIYLKDNYLRDSLDFRKNQSYSFNIATSDTTTYGSGRFSIVLHKK
jgi:hypothetical protein